VVRDVLCLSHLRWDFVYQRPNHLMVRAARGRRVYFVEEPEFGEAQLDGADQPHLRRAVRDGVQVVTPVVPSGLSESFLRTALARLMDELAASEEMVEPILWYYTPMALPWTRHLRRSALVYDSMDFLAGFRGAPAGLLHLEDELLQGADLVFSGGARLHGRLATRGANSHCFPSSVDVGHFVAARAAMPEPLDQASIARPRIGYAGVIDERLDLGLIDSVAAQRPDWQIVLVGPIAKIDPTHISQRPNVHQLGLKAYAELPAYLGGWDVGWMPFARNEATDFISPTKTPEYLAAGLPVVSTSIHDVINPYGRLGLARITDSAADTVAAVEAALNAGRTD
jgi:UDP-galactopyranose mutase